MPSTYQIIASNTLSSSTASVTFSSIPATYTDLVLHLSVRSSASQISDVVNLEINGNTSSIYSTTILYGQGAGGANGSIRSQSNPYARAGYYTSANTATSSTFGSVEFYIPSYTVSQNRQISAFGAAETNSGIQDTGITSNLFTSTTAITSLKITLLTGPNFLSDSSFYLYGIKNS